MDEAPVSAPMPESADTADPAVEPAVEPSRSGSPAAQSRSLIGSPTGLLLGLACMVIILYGMRYAASIINPILLAMFVVMGLSPILRWLRGKGVPPWLTLVIILNAVVDNGIAPRIMSQSVGLTVLVVFLSLVLWTWVLGGDRRAHLCADDADGQDPLLRQLREHPGHLRVHVANAAGEATKTQRTRTGREAHPGDGDSGRGRRNERRHVRRVGEDRRA